jgi:hypothetical protein
MAKLDISELDKLIKESEAAIERLEAAQKEHRGLPLSKRVSNHLRRNSNHFIYMALSGSLMVVAMGRLSQKYQYEVGNAMPQGFFACSASSRHLHVHMVQGGRVQQV